MRLKYSSSYARAMVVVAIKEAVALSNEAHPPGGYDVNSSQGMANTITDAVQRSAVIQSLVPWLLTRLDCPKPELE